MFKKNIFILAVAGCFTCSGSGSFAKVPPLPQTSQTATSSQSGVDQDINLLRQDIRSKKKQLVAANLKLTDAEATKFWPVYDQYTGELVKINNEKYALIKEYADSWGTMTDEQALSLTNRALAVEKNVTDLRIRYVPIFNKVIPGKKVATFFQIERRIQAMIDLQLSSQLPLVQSQE
jgi:outer membrane murein-binding lipoprotein Lpp